MLFFFVYLICISCSKDDEFYSQILEAEIIEEVSAIDNQSENTNINQTTNTTTNVENTTFKNYAERLQDALDKGGLILLEKGTYTIETTLNLNVSGTILDLNGSTITSSTIFRLLNINKNSIEDSFSFTIRNGNFSSTFDTGNSTRDLFGLVTIDNKDVEVGNFESLSFTNPNSSTNAIKIIASVNGTEIKTLLFKDITVENCGQMAIEVNAHNNDYNFVNYVGNIFIENFNANNLGLKSEFGMALSISGNVHNTEWVGGTVESFKDRGIENAGGRVFKVSNVKITNPKTVEDEFIGVSVGAGGGNNYSSNVQTVFNKMQLEGNGVLNLNSDENDIVVSNSTFKGGILFDNRNVEYIDNSIATSNLFQTFSGNHVTVKGGSIVFSDNLSRLAIGGGILNLENVDISKSDDGILVDISSTSTLNCKGTKFTNGYLNTVSGSKINLTNVQYISGLDGNPFRGKGTFSILNVFNDGIQVTTINN